MGNKKKKKIVKNKNKTFKKQVNNHTNDELKKQVNNHNNDEIVPFSNFPEENQTPQPVENKDLTKNQTNKNKENKPIFFPNNKSRSNRNQRRQCCRIPAC